MFSGLRGPVCDAARSARRRDPFQTGEARALAALSRRRAAPAHSSAAGQVEAMAIRTRCSKVPISAPILSNLSLMVPQVALAKTVLARPCAAARRSAHRLFELLLPVWWTPG